MIVHALKADQLNARKNKQELASSLLTTLIAEIEMIGKNDGNRDTTDSEAIAVIKKFIKNADEVIVVATQYHDEPRLTRATLEKALLTPYLPTQLEGETLRSTIQQIVAEVNATTLREMGKVMATLKTRHDGQYDGAAASAMVKQALQ